MKREILFIAILTLSFLTIRGSNCQTYKQGQPVNFEDCYKLNLQDSTLMTGWYYVSTTKSGFVRQLDKTDEFYVINPYPIVTGEDMTTLDIQTNNRGEKYLLIRFGKRGTEQWRIATQKAIGKNLALIVNNKLVYTPFVNIEITVGISTLLRIDYSKKELEKVKEAIENR